METNENWVQLQGKILIPEGLDRAKYLILSGEFEHVSLVSVPNHDGTEDHIYKVAPIKVSIQPGDKKVQAEVRTKASVRLRRAVWKHYLEQGGKEEFFEDYYQNLMSNIIGRLDEIVSLTNMSIEHD